jgi:branched-subunit amino acid ABC-type transport system permease component
LGGLGSYEGTAVSSVLVGLAVAVVAKFSTVVDFPEGVLEFLNPSVLPTVTPMLLLALVLLLRPRGLFGGE